MDAIRFPALKFEKSTVATIDGPEPMTRETRIGLKRRLLLGATIVDYAGNMFGIRRADPVCMLALTSFGEILGYLTGNPRYRLNLEFESKGLALVEDVRGRIQKSFQSDPWWRGMLDFEDFESEVKRAESIPAIIDAFKRYSQ